MAVRLPTTIGIEYVLHTVRTSIFAVASTLIAPIMMVWFEQGRELLNIVELRYFVNEGRPLAAAAAFASWFAFMLGLALWALANWFGSRLLLQRDIDDWLALRNAPGAFIDTWYTWFPRSLGIIGVGVITVYWLKAGLWLAFWSGVAMILAFVWFVDWRRRFIVKKYGARRQHTILHTAERVALWLALGFSLVLFVGLADSNYWLARFLAAPAILFFALGSIVIFGSIVLTYLPTSYGLPALVLIPLLGALVLGATPLNRNHSLVPKLVHDADCKCDERPDAVAYLDEWQQKNPGSIILVATEGGASRAAWWTSHVLSALDYASDGEFAKHVFAISSVSGGSLGAAAYVGLVADGLSANASQESTLRFPTRADCRAMRDERVRFPLPMQAECFVGGDFLSTTLGYLFFPDLLQRFVPGRFYDWDRSLGLEKTWEIDWRYLFGTDARFFEQPLHSIYWPTLQPAANAESSQAIRLAKTPDGERQLPILLMNSARAGAGRSVLQSPVRVDSPELDDLFDSSLRTRELPLSALVHNSARFPLVSPGGDVTKWTGEHWDAVIDGGYFENSGAATLAELLHALQAKEAAGRNGSPSPFGAPETAGSSGSSQDYFPRIRVLLVMNDPKAGRSINERKFVEAEVIEQEELLTPLLGLYNTRSARADSSKRRLLDFLELETQIHEIFLKEAEIEPRPAMSWSMNETSRKNMWCAVSKVEVKDSLCDFLESVDPPTARATCEARLDEFATACATEE